MKYSFDNTYIGDPIFVDHVIIPMLPAFQESLHPTQVYKDSYFPVYTYHYDEQTNILTQYKNGVEFMRMFVPEPYELKESL